MSARTGEAHHKARLSDREVYAMRYLHGIGVSYAVLMMAFRTGRRTVEAICRSERRNSDATGA